jgi:potassium-dependent mechanosensitive channel
MNNLLSLSESIINHPLFEFGGKVFTLVTILEFIVLLISVFIIAKITKIICKSWLFSKLDLDIGSQEAFSKITAYFVAIIGFIIALQTTGVDLTSLAVIVGGLGIGIGFGFQEITKDFISGLILLFARTVKVNDFIELSDNNGFKNIKGRISKISFLVTTLETTTSSTLMIPNNYLVTHSVLNWSYGNKKKYLGFLIKVPQGTDLVLFTETILYVATLESQVLSDPKPELLFKTVGDNFWEFELRVWVNRVDHEPKIRSILNYSIEYHLRQVGISLNIIDQLIFSKMISL